MGIKQLYNDNLWKLPNEYRDVSVMRKLFLGNVSESCKSDLKHFTTGMENFVTVKLANTHHFKHLNYT